MSKRIQLAKCFIKHAKTEKNLIGLCLAIFTAITAIGLYSIFTYVPDMIFEIYAHMDEQGVALMYKTGMWGFSIATVSFAAYFGMFFSMAIMHPEEMHEFVDD